MDNSTKLGKTINTSSNDIDYSLFENDSITFAIYSSYDSKRGNYDISYFELKEYHAPMKDPVIVKGKTLDENGLPIDSMEVQALNSETGEPISKDLSDEMEIFLFQFHLTL